MGPDEASKRIRELPLAVPESSAIVETRFRKRLLQALVTSAAAVNKTKHELLNGGIFSDGTDDATVLTADQLDSLAGAIAAHATPILHPGRPIEELEITQASVFDVELRAIVGTPAPLHATELHVDSMELAARLLRAEELLEEIAILVAPVLDDRDERRSFASYIAQSKKRLHKLWPTKHDRAAENARTPKRAEWMANLVDILSHHWIAASYATFPIPDTIKSKPPTQERIREIASRVAHLLNIPNATTPEGLRKR